VRRLLLLTVLITIPLAAVAGEGPLIRRNGFLLIWESIHRSSEDNGKQSFRDVREGDPGFKEISYAAERGILDYAEYFRPEDDLTMEDALLWIFRTRNIRDLFYMQRENIAGMLNEYPIVEYRSDFGSIIVSKEKVMELMRLLDTILANEEHLVSYYADDFHGHGTAFGETFDMHELTAAHRSLPHNTLVKVTNVENEKSVIVRINDRGPYVDGRDMDLSAAAFEEIANHSQGILVARFQRLGDETYVDTCAQEVRRYQKRITRNVRFHRGIPHTWNTGETLYLGANRYFVVRGVTYPDGHFVRMQDWVGPKERFHFTPSVGGEYVFLIGNKDGRLREMRMSVRSCGSNE